MECGKVYYLQTIDKIIHGRLISILPNRHIAVFINEIGHHQVFMDEVIRCYYDMEIPFNSFIMLHPTRYLPDYILEKY